MLFLTIFRGNNMTNSSHSRNILHQKQQELLYPNFQRHAWSLKPLKQLKSKTFFLMVPQKTYFSKKNNEYKASLISPESFNPWTRRSISSLCHYYPVLACCMLLKDWSSGCCRSKSLLVVVVINGHHQNLMLLLIVGPNTPRGHQLGLRHIFLTWARVSGAPYWVRVTLLQWLIKRSRQKKAVSS